MLDVQGVSSKRDVFMAQRLKEAEIVRLVGAGRPTIAQAGEAIYKINEELGRGECVCFPVYDDAREAPVGWYVVGNTVD